jgi:hypothetical protein
VLLIVAVQVVLAGMLAAGVKVAEFPEDAYATLPVTLVLAGHANLNETFVIVNGSIGSLKFAEINAFNATPTAFAAGSVDRTVGGVTSGAAPVVNDQIKGTAIALPATSVTPVVIVAVQRVLAGSGCTGVKVAILPVEA